MAEMIHLPNFKDDRGQLTVIEQCLPFEIKRVYWISHVTTATRGGHRHLQTVQAAVCVSGGCTFQVKNPSYNAEYFLTKPTECLILAPEDWHLLVDFKPHTVVLMLASAVFDPDDYANEPL